MNTGRSVSFVVGVMALITFLFQTGCGPKLPPGMPKLYPVEILFTQEGAPLVKAIVTLESQDPPLEWTITGTTDEEGKCEPATHGYPGVPAGKFKVTIRKSSIERAPGSMTTRESGSDPDSMPVASNRNASSSVVGYIEEQYTRASTTPLEIEVPLKDRGPITLDAGKPVEIRRSVQGL